MEELNGPISDRLREKFPPDAKEWSPSRPGEPEKSRLLRGLEKEQR